MKCKGLFKFKCMEKKEAGDFINDKGQKVEYPAKYLLIVDEVGEEGFSERSFKVALDSDLIPQLAGLKPYTDVELEMDLQFTKSGAISLTPTSIKPIVSKTN